MKAVVAIAMVLLMPLTTLALEGSGRRSFWLKAPFAEAASKIETLQGHRRLLESQGIRLLDYKTQRMIPSLMDRSINATATIKGHAPKISPYEIEIEEDIQLKTDYAKVVFVLQKPAGRLASETFTLEAFDRGDNTLVRMRVSMGVSVPRRRLSQRLINRVACRRVMQEVHSALWNMQQELIRVTRDEKPADSVSIFSQR
jgi:hypothetical protein